VFRADVPGTYQLELTARTKDDHTAACTTAVTVAAGAGLWIETRTHDRALFDQHLFLASSALDLASTWSSDTGHAWKRRVRPSWSAAGLDDDPVVEVGSDGVASVIRIASPQSGVDYEVGLHRPLKTPPGSAAAETTVWCGGVQAAALVTDLPAPYSAAHLGTVRFTADGTCSFIPGTLTLEVTP
jgi:hypothetical protein